MSVATKWEPLITEAEYLQGEELSEVRHEYYRGEVTAMAGATDTHNAISLGLASRFMTALKGKKCRPFHADMKLRIEWLPGPAYYYPDVMVACDDPPASRLYREQPLILVEVTSESTERIDLKEKVFAYLSIASLKHYLIVSQYSWEIKHYLRTETGWELREYRAPDDVIIVPDIDFRITVADVYEDSGVAAPVNASS